MPFNLRSQHAVECEIADAEKRNNGPSEGNQPGDCDQDHRFAEGERIFRQTVGNHIVTIPGNHGQSHDLTASR